jgi:hypothetical protein
MSLAAFQQGLARLVAEPEYAAAVRGGTALQLDDLTPHERERLVAAASAPGLVAARTVHTGWRMSKLLGLLPLTRAALGDRFARLAADFWSSQPPRSLYFQREAIEFCRFVCAADGVPRATAEVAAFEAAVIELDLGPDETGAEVVELHFEHDPEELLAAVAERGEATATAAPTKVIGRRGADGRHAWSAVRRDVISAER